MNLSVMKQLWPEWIPDEKPLGRGSYGVVYRAVRKDNHVESFCAIKVISIPLDNAELDELRTEGLDLKGTETYLRNVVSDFVEEIQLMENFKGTQNIVSVEDYHVVERANEIGWDIFIRMELLTPFHQYIANKQLSEADVIRIGCDICSALELCSTQNVIHRDIKPENIFVNKYGHFKLGDFGIARKLGDMSECMSQKGTYSYMAPEVFARKNYDARADVYSLGLVLYKLLNNNRLPFMDDTAQLMNPNYRQNAVERRLRGEILPWPQMASPALAQVIVRACAPDPAMRFCSATEMKQALLGAGQFGSTLPDNGFNQENLYRQQYTKPDSEFNNYSNMGSEKVQKPRKSKKVFWIVGGVAAGVLACVLCLVLCLGFGGNGVVSSGGCGNDVNWTLYKRGELLIEGTGEMYHYSDKGPHAPWYKYIEDIKEITVHEGVTTLGDFAFDNCGNLKRVDLPDSLQTIGSYTFRWCSLPEIYIPDGVSIIGTAAFYQCGELVRVGGGNGLVRIYDYAFHQCVSLGSFVFGDSVYSIGGEAFSGCIGLYDIDLGNSVVEIGDYAFKWTGVNHVEIPDSTTKLGVGAFYDCGRIELLIIGDSLDTVGSYAFYQNTKLSSVEFGAAVNNIGPKAFNGCDNISQVAFSGDRQKWETVKISEGNDPLYRVQIAFSDSE